MNWPHTTRNPMPFGEALARAATEAKRSGLAVEHTVNVWPDAPTLYVLVCEDLADAIEFCDPFQDAHPAEVELFLFIYSHCH